MLNLGCSKIQLHIFCIGFTRSNYKYHLDINLGMRILLDRNNQLDRKRIGLSLLN